MTGNLLLSGTESGKIQVWDMDKAVFLQEIEAHEGKFCPQYTVLSNHFTNNHFPIRPKRATICKLFGTE